MRDLLLRVIHNAAVRKALIALVLAVLAAAGVSLGTGCGAALPPAVAKARDVFECRVAALETVVPLPVAEDLIMAARAGNGSYVVKQLLGLGLTPETIARAADEFHACDAPASPEPDAGAPAVEPS